MVLYELFDEESDYRIVETLEEAMKEILDIPFKLLEEEYELEEEEFNNLKVGYSQLIMEACETLGIPLIGEDILTTEF